MHLNFEKSIKMKKVNIAIFASGGGTNCENIIRYFKDSAEVCTALVVSNKPDAQALERASQLGIPTAVAPKTQLNDPDFLFDVAVFSKSVLTLANENYAAAAFSDKNLNVAIFYKILIIKNIFYLFIIYF